MSTFPPQQRKEINAGRLYFSGFRGSLFVGRRFQGLNHLGLHNRLPGWMLKQSVAQSSQFGMALRPSCDIAETGYGFRFSIVITISQCHLNYATGNGKFPQIERLTGTVCPTAHHGQADFG
jgi:hypothetical protein